MPGDLPLAPGVAPGPLGLVQQQGLALGLGPLLGTGDAAAIQLGFVLGLGARFFNQETKATWSPCLCLYRCDPGSHRIAFAAY